MITTGSNNVVIGSGSDPSAADGSNQIVVGYDATGQANNSVTLGNADVTAVYMAQDKGATVYAAGMVVSDDGTIGSESDANAIAISSGGVVTLSAATASTSASSGALVVGGGAGVAADLYVGDDLALISDAAVLSLSLIHI